jgi:hypothetical protein
MYRTGISIPSLLVIKTAKIFSHKKIPPHGGEGRGDGSQRGTPSSHQTNHELAGSLRASRRISSRYSVHVSTGVLRLEFLGLVIHVRKVPAVFVDNFALDRIDDDRASTTVPVSPSAMFGIQKLVG